MQIKEYLIAQSFSPISYSAILLYDDIYFEEFSLSSIILARVYFYHI